MSRTLVVAALLIVWAAPPPAVAAEAPTSPGTCRSAGEACEGLRPGALLVIAPFPYSPDGEQYCTFGFILDGRDGHRYATSAGHCLGWLLNQDGPYITSAAYGERAWPNGSGIFAHTADGQRVGEFVYAINTREVVPEGLPPDADISLIRLDRGVEADPEVCAFGGPTGIDDRIITDLDPLDMNWFGITWAGARVPATAAGPHSWLLPARSGYSLGMPRERIVQVAGHTWFGDSGGPVLGADGRAVGLISGPPAPVEDPDELPTDGRAGSFIVTRLGPQLARASEVLGARFTLCCSGGGANGSGNAPPGCAPCPAAPASAEHPGKE